MSTANKIGWLVITLAIVIVGVGAEFIPVRVDGVKFQQHTVNAGELINGYLVGQTFVSPQDNLSGISILFATYSGRENTEPVEFHLRTSPIAGEDLRSAKVHPSKLGDNQFHTFTFEPLTESANEDFFFFVTSPTSSPGNAVTVDLNSQDPYHLGSVFLYRGEPGIPPEPGGIERSGKQTVDVVFGTSHTVSLRQATLASVREAIITFRGTWDEKRSTYLNWLILALPLLSILFLTIFKRREEQENSTLPKKVVIAIISLLFILAIGLRLFYAIELPITNDEGNYLYDAKSLSRGVLAGGDGYVKAPLVILWVSLWQILVGDTVLAGRLASIIMSSLLVIPIYWLGREAYNQRSGLLAAALWATLGAPVVFGIYVHTQAVALFFGISGLAVLWLALRDKIGIKSRADGLLTHTGNHWFIYAGILLGLGVASRKSILALGLVPLILILIESLTFRLRLQRLILVGVGFLLVIGLFLASAFWLYGPEGVLEALGFNSAEDGITAVDPAEAEQVRAYSLRGMTPFFREALPLLFFGLLGWGLLLETSLRLYLKTLIQRPPARYIQFLLEHILPKLLWILPVIAAWWAAGFFFEYEGSIYHEYGGIWLLWYVFAAFLGLMIIWPRPLTERFSFTYQDESQTLKRSTQPSPNTVGAAGGLNTVGKKRKILSQKVEGKKSNRELFSVNLLFPAWLFGLVIFYVNWIKFHANYIVEFLPPLVILSSVCLVLVWQRISGKATFAAQHPFLHLGSWVLSAVFIIFFLWSGYVTNHLTYTVPHTGTFEQGSVREAAEWATRNIPQEQTIFTGAAVVPYLSGHRTALDIAHPRWYAYEFTRKDTTRLNTFLPPVEEMLTAYREAEWLLLERQTGFSFLMEYSEIEAGLETNWELVHSVENGSNTLEFYRRLN